MRIGQAGVERGGERQRERERKRETVTILWRIPPTPTASDRRGNTFKGFKDVRAINGSSQGQNLALTVLYVPSSLDSGPARDRALTPPISKPYIPSPQHYSNPTPHTLHPTPNTLHPTPYTLHPAPDTLHPTPDPADVRGWVNSKP